VILANPEFIDDDQSAENQGAGSRPQAAAPSTGRPYGPAIGWVMALSSFIARQ
jgi:hypothetical protein